MPIEFLCPSCNKQLRVPDTAAGKQAKCPSCDNVCSIPTSAAPRAANVATAYAPTSESPANPFSEPQSSGQEHLKETNYFPNQATGETGAAGSNPYASPSLAANVNMPASFKTASRLSRFGGKLIDNLLMGLTGAVIGGGLAAVGASLGDEEIAFAGWMGGLYLGMFLYAVANWIMIVKSGQTVGKKLVGTRIVSENTGQIPDFVQGVLLRSIVFGMLNFIPFLGLIDACWIFGENHQCLHDLLAKTRVVEA